MPQAWVKVFFQRDAIHVPYVALTFFCELDHGLEPGNKRNHPQD